MGMTIWMSGMECGKSKKKRVEKQRKTKRSAACTFTTTRKHNRVRPTSVRIFYIVNTQQWNRLVNIIVSSCT